MARQFARLRRGSVPDSADVSVVPNDGMCLSVFLVFRPADPPGTALLGKLDPAAPWRELSALGPDRIARLTSYWMLPASQLLLFESPDEAARRISREQLGIELAAPGNPRVFSETSARPGAEGKDPHWDIHFVYELPWPKDRPLRAAPWKELAWLPISETPHSTLGRGHGDVLELVGLSPSG
jgi:ADP-ribose pyrophosphatase YjhB (NUDIX family)